MGERDDEIRRAILARRATFLAAAVAGVALDGCGGRETPPQVVTVVTPSEDGAAPEPEPIPGDAPVDGGAAPPDVDPRPCLSVAQVPPDASAGDAGAPKGAPDAGAHPMPCLVPPLPTTQPTGKAPSPPHPPTHPPLKKPLPMPCLSPSRM